LANYHIIKHVDDLPEDLGLIKVVDMPIRNQAMADRLPDLARFKNLESLLIYVERDAGSADLAEIGSLPGLSAIQIGGYGNSNNLKYLAEMPAIRTLSLIGQWFEDKHLAHIKDMRKLEMLGIQESALDGSGLSSLQNLKNLKVLYFRASQHMGDYGLEHISQLPLLESVMCQGVALTDAGLRQLEVLKTLKQIDLTGTKVTLPGMTRFKQALPDCRIKLGTGDFELPDPKKATAHSPAVSVHELLTSPDYGWTEPVNLGKSINTGGNEAGACLSADGLTLYFHSDRSGGSGTQDLWQTTRSAQDQPFTQPTNMGPLINSGDSEQGPAISSDGLEMIFFSNRPGGKGELDLWRSTRSSVNQPFGKPTNLGDEVNSNSLDAHPSLSPDGKSLVFVSTRPGGRGDADFYIAMRENAKDEFGKAVHLPEISSSTGDFWTRFTPDGKAIVFGSYRKPRIGAENLWITKRNSQGSFEKPVQFSGPMNTSHMQGAATFTPDGQQVIFDSARPGTQGKFDIWMCRRLQNRDTKNKDKPAPAIAPFDEAQAKAHQEAWANHLGEPVETTNSIGMKLAMIPPGSFTMGENDNTVDVTLTKPFRLSRHELTQGQWKTVMETEPWQGQKGVQEGKSVPATFVNWTDATEFCLRLTALERGAGKLPEGWEYRLPTDAEWEWACRSGTTTTYSFGDDESQLGEYAWYETNTKNAGEAYAHAVGLKRPNGWGLHDVHGNVWEWCRDWRSKLEGGTDPVGPLEGLHRVPRGGSWSITAGQVRSADRGGNPPWLRLAGLGFRVAMTIDTTKLDVVANAPTPTGMSLIEMHTSPDYEWTEPENLGPIVNSVGIELRPTLTQDQLTIYFPRRGKVKQGIWKSHRNSIEEPFGEPVEADPPFTFRENGVFLFDRDLKIVYTTRIDEVEQIWIASRSAVDQPFSDAEYTGVDGSWPAMTADGLTMVFRSPDEPKPQNLCIAERATLDDRFGPSEVIQKGGTEPYLFRDGLTLLFGYKDGNIVVSRRSARDKLFGKPVPLGEPFTAGTYNGGACVTTDQRKIYFISRRPDSVGDADIYRSTLVPKTSVPKPQKPRATDSASAPPPAVAPFNEAQAKAHQQAWAKHLGVPVEYTNSVGMKFVLVPPGTFMMGSTAEEIAAAPHFDTEDDFWPACAQAEGPRHQSSISQPFYLARHEVTQKAYTRIMGHNPSVFSETGSHKQRVAGLDTSQFPVETVKWNEALAFCDALSEHEQLEPVSLNSQDLTAHAFAGIGYRLPTEAEWEYACRAGTTATFYFGSLDRDLNRAGYSGANSGNRPHPVGELQPNPFGLFDMHGNIWEYVLDHWDFEFYQQFKERPAIDSFSRKPATDGRRGVRGGFFAAPELRCSSSRRFGTLVAHGYEHIGFRVLLSVDAVRQAVTAAVPPKDLDKAAVELVISKKAQAIIMAGGERKLIENVASLPSDDKFEFRGFVTSGVRWSAPPTGSLTDADCVQLAKCKNIDQLWLQETQVTSAGLAHFRNHNIEWLDLNERFGKESIPVVQGFKKLKYLGLPNVDTNIWMAALNGNTSIVALDCNRTSIDSQGAAHLATMPNLKLLDLTSTGVSTPGWTEVSRMKSLKYLALGSSGGVTDEGLKSLAKLTTLKTLIVSTTSPFPFVEELRKSLKDCQIKQGRGSEVWTPLTAGAAWSALTNAPPRE